MPAMGRMTLICCIPISASPSATSSVQSMSAFLRDARQNTFNVGSPGVQSGPALREKLVALVDSGNP